MMRIVTLPCRALSIAPPFRDGDELQISEAKRTFTVCDVLVGILISSQFLTADRFADSG
jgi:hypothetical protein